MLSLPDFSGTSARPFLLKLETSRLLLCWWLLLHLILAAAAFAMIPRVAVALGSSLMLGYHAVSRFPGGGTLLLVGPGGKYALPAEGRFDLSLAAATRFGSFWVELVFDDRPGRRLLLRDQFTDSDWRRLRIALRESI